MSRVLSLALLMGVCVWGTPSGFAQTTFTPSSLGFGNQVVNVTSAPKTATFKNTQTVALTIFNITISGGNAGDYGFSSNCPISPSSLGAGKSCSITVKFTPSQTGNRTSTLSVANNASVNPQTVSLGGTGVLAVALSATTMNLGTVYVGNTSAAPLVTLTNNQKTGLTFSGIAASGDFGIASNTCGNAIAGGATCKVGVHFVPTATGVRTGILTFADTGSNSPQSVNLTGIGLAPVSIAPASLTFVSTTMGATSAARIITITNHLTTALPMGTPVVSGDFNVASNSCGASVSAGNNCAIGISFSPTQVGPRPGSLTVTYGAFGSPGVVTLSGIGNATGLASIAVTPTNTSIPVGATQQFTAIGTFRNGSKVNLTNAVTWTSSMPGIATIAAGGLATGNAGGVSKIVASLSGVNSPAASMTVIAPILQSIVVTSVSGSTVPAAPTIADGMSVQLYATGQYSNNSTQDLTRQVNWTSNSANMTVSNASGSQGMVTGAAVGTGTVSANLGAVTGSATVTVGAATLKSIAITPATIASWYLGQTQQFRATGTFTDGTTKDVTTTVTWSSSAPSVATIIASGTNAGQATSVGQGTVTFSASAAGSTTAMTGTLTVGPAALTSITVTPPDASIALGTTQAFTATGNYTDGSHADLTMAVTWTGMANPDGAATFNGNIATGATKGTMIVSATSVPGVVGSTTLFITDAALTSIAVSPQIASIYQGQGQQFKASGTFSDGTTQDLTATAAWSSSNGAVATVSTFGPGAGLATSVAAGATSISATSGGIVSTNTGGDGALTVVGINSITVSPGGVSLGLNGTQQFTATGTYADGTTADVTSTATWTSFNPAVVGVGTATTSSSTPGLATVIVANDAAVAVTATLGSVAPFGSTNTGYVSALSTLPVVCTTRTVDMRLLVVNNSAANGGAGYADFPAIQQILNYVGTPYTVADASSGTLPPLSDGACHGYFQGVIYAFGDDIYTFPYSVAYSLATYEANFGVRQLNWFTNPTQDFGLNNASSSVPSTGTDSGTFTVAAAPIFFYANTATPVTISNAFIYLTTPVTGATVTPLLVDPAGNTLSAITQFSDGRQYLSQMFDSNQYLTHDLVLAYGLLNWVTRGVFLGDYHVYASAQVDDFFIDDAEWVPGTPCTNPITHDRTPPDAPFLGVVRVDATNDMAAVVAWQNKVKQDPLLSQFELTMAFNGVGTTGDNTWTGLPNSGVSNDDLVSNVQNYQANFHWIAHTFDHPNTLNGLTQSTPNGNGDDVDLEVLTNLYVANGTGVNLDQNPSQTVTSLNLTDFSHASMVTPGVTGLNDPNVPGYLYNDGIQYVVTDTSVIGQPNNGPNPSPNVGIINSYAPGLFEVPRHPNDVFFNAANWADDQAEFYCIYNNPVQPPYNAYDAAQIQDFVSSSFVTNMLIGDMDPEMFHQPNLHFADNGATLGLTQSHFSSLLSDTYDQTFAKYESLYKLPVLSPTLDQTAALMQNRSAFNLSGVTATLSGFGSATPHITITMPSTSTVPSAIIPVTGLNSTGAESYGGQNISHINLTPGLTVTLPLQ